MAHLQKDLTSPYTNPFSSLPLLQLKYLVWLALGVGFLLRTVQYSLDISLWIDEAFIALNIIDRSFFELLEPLDYRQGAPFGFLALEKLAISALGTSEWVLRLVPFISGILALYLFQIFARRFSQLSAVAVATGLFALSDRLIYFSAEVKQYSTDVAIALLLYLLLINKPIRHPSRLKYLLMAFFGSLALWFSHPTVFILAGVGLPLWLVEIREKNWRGVFGYLSVFLTWFTSFVIFYWVSLRSLTSNEALQQSFQENHDAFMPLFPTSSQDINWFVENFFGFFNSPLGFPTSGIAAFCFLAGVYAIWHQDKLKLSLLILPILITLLASGLHQYPFKSRLLLFTVPLVLLIIAEGLIYLCHCLRPDHHWLGYILAGLLFFHPLYYAAGNLKNPRFITNDSDYQRVREDIKPVLAYVRQNRQVGDVIYLYYATQYAFKYYIDRFEFSDLVSGEAVDPPVTEDWFEPALPSYPPRLVVGQYSREDWGTFERELEGLNGHNRVWFIFSHAHDRRSSINEETAFLYLIDRVGTQRAAVSDVEASAYLYDLSRT